MEEEEMLYDNERIKGAAAKIQERVHNRTMDVLRQDPSLDVDSVLLVNVYYELGRLQIRIEDYENRNTLK